MSPAPGRALRAALLSTALLWAGPAHAGTREFKHVVASLSRHYQARPTGTGFLGFLMRMFSPRGVSAFRLAVFEGVNESGAALGEDIDRFIREGVGPDFIPFLQVRSAHPQERVFIYCREAKGRLEMLLVSAEVHEAVVMSMTLDGEALAAWINDPAGQAKGFGGSGHGNGTAPAPEPAG